MKSSFDCYLPGIIDAIKAATTRFLLFASTGGIVPRLHGDANDLIPLIMEDHGCDGGINTSAHCYQYSAFGTHVFRRKITEKGRCLLHPDSYRDRHTKKA